MLWLSLSVAAGLLVLVPGPRVAARRPSSSDSHPLLLVPRLVRTRRERPRAVPIRLALAIRAAERLRRAWSDDGSPQARAAVSRGLGGSARRLQALATISLRKSRGQSAEDVRTIRSTGERSADPAEVALEWPVRGPITSGFGRRWGGMHEGIDIGVPEGTPVRAAAPGTVAFAGSLDGDGNVVVLDHGAGVSTAYLHLSAILVSAGTVAAGSEIGTSGCTGYCFGPHLHFELRIGGTPIDPLPVLSAAARLPAHAPLRSSEIASRGCCRAPHPRDARRVLASAGMKN